MRKDPGRDGGLGRYGAVVLMVVLGAAGGCEISGIVASAFDKDYREYSVSAAYHSLDNQVVAVLVAMPNNALYRYPQAQLGICKAISSDISQNVPGARLIDPEDLVKFQRDNPYWSAVRYSELIAILKADRMVFVDMGEFSLYEPGNSVQLKGVAVADVGIFEAESIGRSESFAYQVRVEARYPPDEPFGLLHGSEQDAEFATVKKFATRVAWLFYDHTELRKKKLE